MDDADGGRRGLRPRLSPDLLEAIEKHYGLVDAQPVDLGGSSSLNLVFVRGGVRQIVRVYRTHVTEARLTAIHRVRVVLSNGGVPTARLVESRDGSPLISYQGHLIEAEDYVEYDSACTTGTAWPSGCPPRSHPFAPDAD